MKEKEFHDLKQSYMNSFQNALSYGDAMQTENAAKRLSDAISGELAPTFESAKKALNILKEKNENKTT